ncbi:MAG: GNAT family N-acetyltransferase [Caldilineales bacterium]
MHDLHLAIEELPAAHDIEFMEQRIIEYNYRAAGAADGRGLNSFVRDQEGTIVAGITGYTWAGIAEIEFLWVDERLRGRGVGARLLHAVEAEARARGCARIIVSTYSFQAPGFYQSHGYTVSGQINDCPPGHTNYWLKKELA